MTDKPARVLSVVCSTCRGDGTVVRYLAAAGGESPKPVTCPDCRGKPRRKGFHPPV